MESILNVVNWLKDNFGNIVIAYIALIGLAEVITQWTETKKDDDILGSVRAFAIKIIVALSKFAKPTEKADKLIAEEKEKLEKIETKETTENIENTENK